MYEEPQFSSATTVDIHCSEVASPKSQLDVYEVKNIYIHITS